MLIIFGRTAAIVGRDPEPKDLAFVQLANHWHQEWVKDGRPQSNQGF